MSPLGARSVFAAARSVSAAANSGEVSPIVSAEVTAFIGTISSSAAPSWLGTATFGVSVRYFDRGGSPGRSSVSAGRAATNFCAAACCSVLTLPLPSMTRMKGSDSVSLNFATSFITSVDSAFAGRNEALSFFCTSERRPTSGPPTAETPNHTRRAARATNLTAQRDRIRELPSSMVWLDRL